MTGLAGVIEPQVELLGKTRRSQKKEAPWLPISAPSRRGFASYHRAPAAR